MAYAMTKQNSSNNTQKTKDEQQANSGQQGRRQDPRQKTVNIQREDTGYTKQDNEVLKTQYGRTMRKPDRLKYKQITSV